MTGLKKMTGLPVILNGKAIGSVMRGVLTEDGRGLRGIVVRGGLRGARWVPREQIALVGRISVIAARRNAAGNGPGNLLRSLGRPDRRALVRHRLSRTAQGRIRPCDRTSGTGGGEGRMSKLFAAAMAGYLLGMKHRSLSRELCWARMKKHALRLMRMF